jgi:hypothetical protein
MSDMRLLPFTPAAIEAMLDFASRHNVAPQTEPSPISDINNGFRDLNEARLDTTSCWTLISDPPDDHTVSSDKMFSRQTAMSGPPKTAIVTGASPGIGEGIVKGFVHIDI